MDASAAFFVSSTSTASRCPSFIPLPLLLLLLGTWLLSLLFPTAALLLDPPWCLSWPSRSSTRPSPLVSELTILLGLLSATELVTLLPRGAVLQLSAVELLELL